MKTANLIDVLAQDAPVRWKLSSLLTVAFAAGATITSAYFMRYIHLRPDLGAASETMRVQFKLLLALTLLIGATGAVSRVGRPDASPGPWAAVLVAVPVLLCLGVIAEMFAMPAQSWMPRLIGHNSMYCITHLPALALAPLACLLAALRESAPARPGLAGAAAGLAASGIAAVLYASHCPDDSPLFVATWYSASIAAVTAVGYLAGTRLLKW